MIKDKIYLVMNGGGEYESQWDEPLRAFRSKEKANAYMEQLKSEHEIDKKYSQIARKAVDGVSRMRGGLDLQRWQNDVFIATKSVLKQEGLSDSEIERYQYSWQTFTDIIFWIDEIDYDKSK
jgi:hypothetical protein